MRLFANVELSWLTISELAMSQILLVDGYNMIGAWSELRQLADDNLEDARDRLIELLANYQGFSGKRIILVFDAHQVPGAGGKV